MNIIIPKGLCKFNTNHPLDEQTLSTARGVILRSHGQEFRLIVPANTYICTPCLESLFSQFADNYLINTVMN